MDALSALALAGSLAALAGSLYAVTRSTNARTQRIARECAEAVGEIEAAWRTERAALAKYLEEVEGLLESVERKRKSTAASASRLNQGNGAEPDLTNATPEQIREHYTRVARQRGLLG